MIRLLLIGRTRQDLQVGLPVQTANGCTAERDDVIDFMPDSGGERQSGGLRVDRPDGVMVGPCWSSPQFRGIPPSDQRVDSVGVVLGPTPILGTAILSVGLAPQRSLLSRVIDVVLVPLRERARVLLVPFSGSGNSARTARGGQTVGARRAPGWKLTPRFDLSADVARIQPCGKKPCGFGPFGAQRWLSKMRPAGFAGGGHAKRTEGRFGKCAEWQFGLTASTHLGGWRWALGLTFLVGHWPCSLHEMPQVSYGS